MPGKALATISLEYVDVLTEGIALSRRFHNDSRMFELFVILIDFHVGVPPSNIYATCERR